MEDCKWGYGEVNMDSESLIGTWPSIQHGNPEPEMPEIPAVPNILKGKAGQHQGV